MTIYFLIDKYNNYYEYFKLNYIYIYTVHLLCPSPVISVVLSCASNPDGLFLQLFTYYKKNGISKSATFYALDSVTY
jgi:hypothetical protein